MKEANKKKIKDNITKEGSNKMKGKTKSEEKPEISEYSFSPYDVDNTNKIKHPTNVTGTRKRHKDNEVCNSITNKENRVDEETKKE